MTTREKLIDQQLRAALKTALVESTQADFAKKAKVPQAYISRFASGENIRLDIAAKIAKALGLELVQKGTR